MEVAMNAKATTGKSVATTRKAPAPPADASASATLDDLRRAHAEARRRRNGAELGSEEYRAAADEVGRIEVEIARVQREMDPPLV
jgi:hypothetical protein